MVGRDLCRALSDAADRWLTELLDGEADVALVAVGGYGRRELCFGSDLDVILVHAGRRDIDAVAQRLWYPVWDAGVGLDHSVRTVKEALSVAASDLRAALGLLDARFVAGRAELAVDIEHLAGAAWEAGRRTWIPVLDSSVRDRHERFGEVAFLLEPDIKEGRGGLRDVHAMHALARVAPELADLDDDDLARAYDLLLAVRVELHRRAGGRALDVLLLQEQDGIADALGMDDGDALMAEVSSAARTIAWHGDDAWRRARSSNVGWLRNRRTGRGIVPVLDAGLRVDGGEIVLTPDADLSDPALVWRAASASARTATPLARELLAQLAAVAPSPPDPWPVACRDALLAFLATGTAAIATFDTLDRYGLLERMIPEWSAVRCRPQRNAYHRFTVDRHLCETVARAADRAASVPRRDLLLVGSWLHDIGKGFPGDHTAAGVEVVRTIGARMGFAPPDVDLLVAMVRHHLLLPDVATRRDLDDPETVEFVARQVGDVTTLELLAVLTEADSLATGPAAWGDWKAGLVADLVDRVRRRLAGDDLAPAPAFPTPEQHALLAESEMLLDVGPTTTVIAPDRPGLFARVAGVLALNGLDVRSAQIGGIPGRALEVFTVEPTHDWPDPEKVRDDLERAITGRFALAARLAERERIYAQQRRPETAETPQPSVTFDHEASATATVVEVRASDAIGVLYRIARALADLDLDVGRALVTTLGAEVIDTFYVCDLHGNKIGDPSDLAEIERAVLAALAA